MNMKRHVSHCSICQHPERTEIDEKIVARRPMREIEAEYGLPEGASYRHAKAVGTWQKRQDNLLACCEIIIEKGLANLEPSTAHVLEAMKVKAKLTGQWVDRFEVDAQFANKTDRQLEHYTRTGVWVDDDVLAAAEETDEGGTYVQ